ncbi:MULTISPECIES: hypothetical protein [unclassified Streptomyces]|uniref:hypothetical protein n=1 Tax=unclassified Streptomyces TaxID=2593676 RepID=UPI00336A4F80
MVGVEADAQRRAGVGAGVGEVLDVDVLDAAPGCLIPLRVEGDPHVDQLAPPDVLDVEVVDLDVPDEVAVAGVDGDAALVEHLRFAVVEDVDAVAPALLAEGAQIADGDVLGLGDRDGAVPGVEDRDAVDVDVLGVVDEHRAAWRCR